MVLDEFQNRAVLGLLLHRTGLIDTMYRWPNATLPYTIADGYFNAAQIEHLEYGLRIISNVSCIRFVHRTNEENYVEVTVIRMKRINSQNPYSAGKMLHFRVTQMKDVGHMWVM